MTPTKNDNKWLLWLAGIIATITIGVITAIAGTTNKNEKNAVKEHIAIRKESQDGDDKIRLAMERSFSELRAEMQDARKDQMEMYKNQDKKFTQILLKLGEISK